MIEGLSVEQITRMSIGELHAHREREAAARLVASRAPRAGTLDGRYPSSTSRERSTLDGRYASSTTQLPQPAAAPAPEGALRQLEALAGAALRRGEAATKEQALVLISRRHPELRSAYRSERTEQRGALEQLRRLARELVATGAAPNYHQAFAEACRRRPDLQRATRPGPPAA